MKAAHSRGSISLRLTQAVLVALVAATLLATLVVLYATTAPPAQASDAIGVEVKADTSTTPPPATLGGYSMTPFAPDSRPLFEDVSTVPASEGGTLQFDLPMLHLMVDENGWASNWGHSYKGDVYFSNGRHQLVMTLPTNTHAFYLHAQPNAYDTYTVTATADDGTTSGPVPVRVGPPDDQMSSAGYVGFYSKDGSALNTIKVEVPSDLFGVGIGEFGIAYGYNFSGFFSPVDNPEVDTNKAKAGSAIPVKFSLGEDKGLDIFESGYPKSATMTCDSTDSVDAIEETVTAGSSSLSYDATTDQYTYVWKTNRAWANTCRQLVVKLNDGSTPRLANFTFVK
jgi:hypothetical protein